MIDINIKFGFAFHNVNFYLNKFWGNIIESKELVAIANNESILRAPNE